MSTATFEATPQTETAPKDDGGSWVESGRGEAARDSQGDAGDAGQLVLVLKRKLEEAASDLGRVQTNLATQQQLEHLLKQGRTHLQEMRSRLQDVTAERDRLNTEFGDHKIAHERDVERLQAQIDETTRQAFLQRTQAEQRERDLLAKDQDQHDRLDGLERQLQKTTVERDRLTAQLQDQEAAYKQFADERADERATFERVIAEATANQREMVQELDEKRQQIETLREAAMRAQSLARQIMRAHEAIESDSRKP